MQKIALLSLLLILSVNSFEYFFSNPEQNFYLGSVQATCIEIANDQSKVVVGFQSGLVQTYNTQGRFIANITGHKNPIINIEWIGNLGFSTLDNSGFIIVSWANGTQVANFTFPSTGNTLTNMINAYSEQENSLYIGLIYNTNVVEYKLSLTNSTFNYYQTYNVNNIVTAIYTPTHDQIIIGNSNSQIISFNTSTGTQIIDFVLNNKTNPVSFFYYGNSYLLLDSTSTFTQFNTNGTYGNQYQMNKPGSVATICPTNSQIIFGYNSQAVLVAFQYGQTIGQQMSYLKSNVRALSCGQNNLVSLDNANNLAFNSYNIVDSKVLGWVIAVIIISIILFIALVVTVIYCICKRRKQQALLNNSDYGKELNSSRR